MTFVKWDSWVSAGQGSIGGESRDRLWIKGIDTATCSLPDRLGRTRAKSCKITRIISTVVKNLGHRGIKSAME